MTTRELEEYRVLRATIAERGTARHYVFLAGIVSWGALLVATAATMSLPIATLVPLLALAASFEAVFALHVGVERIGRYLHVFHETDTEPPHVHWEHAIAAFGSRAGAGGPAPLFGRLYLLATAANMIPMAFAGALPVEWGVLGALHALFAWHIIRAQRYAARQRAADQHVFESLRQGL